MRVVVTGAGGMVGCALVAYCISVGDEVFAYDRCGLDISDEDSVRATLERERPDVVINCAAWTDVDGCETNPERAFAVNSHGPEILALQSRKISAGLVTISTDYVFDGEKEGFYTQRDDPSPQSVYAASKLEGERRAQAACARTSVIRTGLIFGKGGKNFLSRVIDLSKSGKPLKAICDSYGTPTYAEDLGVRLRELASLDLPGIYHVVNSGEGASYEEFARAAVTLADGQAEVIEGVSMESLGRPAPRPRNSRLRCIISEAIGLAPLRSWQEALVDFARRAGSGESYEA